MRERWLKRVGERQRERERKIETERRGEKDREREREMGEINNERIRSEKADSEW